MLELSPIERTIAKQAVRSGNPLPDRIANAPRLLQGLELYLNAFFELDSERTHAMSPTPIPWTSICSYAEAYDFDETQASDLFFFVRKMDSDHLKRVASKMSKG